MTAIASSNRDARTLRTVYTGLIEIRVVFVCLAICLLLISYYEGNSEELHLIRANSGRTLMEVTGGDTPKIVIEDPQKKQTNSVRQRSPLDIPEGEAVALPSIRIEDNVSRGQYGGKGDKKHLGGFTAYDKDGVSPGVWKYMISNLGVKSLMDVGCGKGVSSLWFAEHGVKTLCLEGSHDAVSNTLLPDPENQVVEHDFSRGPYWPADTYDAVWSVEFTEHVGRNYHHNYITAFRKAALIFVSHSQWGGWHHVEVHDDDWWINRFESFGLRYSDSLTKQIRGAARDERQFGKGHAEDESTFGPNGKPYDAAHIWLHMQVFINPAVASLPEHAHLFAEQGCYKERKDGKMVHRDCGTGRGGSVESVLPDSFLPLKLTPDQDEAWFSTIKEHIQEATTEETK